MTQLDPDAWLAQLRAQDSALGARLDAEGISTDDEWRRNRYQLDPLQRVLLEDRRSIAHHWPDGDPLLTVPQLPDWLAGLPLTQSTLDTAESNLLWEGGVREIGEIVARGSLSLLGFTGISARRVTRIADALKRMITAGPGAIRRRSPQATVISQAPGMLPLRNTLTETLAEALVRVDPRYLKVLVSHIGSDITPARPLNEIAKEMGLSRARARQLKARALARSTLFSSWHLELQRRIISRLNGMQPLVLEEFLDDDDWLHGFPGGAPSLGRLIEAATRLPYAYSYVPRVKHPKLWAWEFDGQTIVSRCSFAQFENVRKVATIRCAGVASPADRMMIVSELLRPLGAEELSGMVVM